MDLSRVVSALGILLLLGPGSDRVLDVGLRVLGADHEADLTRGVGRDGGVGVLGNGEDGLAVLLEASDEGEVKPGALGCEQVNESAQSLKKLRRSITITWRIRNSRTERDRTERGTRKTTKIHAIAGLPEAELGKQH